MIQPAFGRALISLLLTFFCICAYSATQPYLVGTGIYDITGPAAEIDLMGYADPKQLSSGLHSRLWSRAFVIADPKTQKRVVFISADLGMIFQSVKQGVVNKLANVFPDKRYIDQNIMISATHTHSGPGGYAFDTLYNFTVRGFYKAHYETIVNGIVQSIIRADHNLEPGNILISQTNLQDDTVNRSIKAYEKNPIEERQRYDASTDKSMLQIKFVAANGQPLGLINWHAVHGVSMSSQNTLISGDNKGFASYLFEQQMGSNYLNDKTFVAAFAQANEGDASPNISGYHPDGHCTSLQCQDLSHTFDIGRKQYSKAKMLFDTAVDTIGNGLDFRHQYVDMSAIQIEPSFNRGIAGAHTCQAALGYAFGAGTTDGPGLDGIFHQGQVKGDLLVNLLRNIIAEPTDELEKCQKPKPILLAVGLNKPAWVPHRMPVQLFKIGHLLIIGAPGEFTTMAGRRLKQDLQNTFGSDDVSYVAFAGLSNSYAGYVTTFEEYQQQNYEGGFTVFGQWTLAAYLQSFHHLAQDMIDNQPSARGELPEDLSANTASLISPVLFDDKPITKKFGSVHQQPKSQYMPGDIVHVSFWSGHPRNNFQTMKGFLAVQRFEKNQWQTVAHDWDFSTIYSWERIGIAYAYAHIYWKIPQDAKPGEYRIQHFGHYKYGWDQKIYAYQGDSNVFKVIGE